MSATASAYDAAIFPTEIDRSGKPAFSVCQVNAVRLSNICGNDIRLRITIKICHGHGPSLFLLACRMESPW